MKMPSDEVENGAVAGAGAAVVAQAPLKPVAHVYPPRLVPTYLPLNKPAVEGDAAAPSPLTGDPALYARIAASPRRLVARHGVAIRSATAWTVKAGQVFRLCTPAGAQVGDLNVWALGNARERFWASRTRQLHAAHVSTGHRLWSCLPYLRPLATITADSLAGGAWGNGPDATAVKVPDGRGGETDDVYGGGLVGCHDLLGTRCDPYANRLLTGGKYNFNCHSNLTRAVLPWGLDERDVHDVINVFQVTGLDSKGRYWQAASPARPGDYLELFAEVDLLCAMSSCPGGDLSEYGWVNEGSEDPMLKTCKPLEVQVYELENREEVLKGWKEPESPVYTGMHGMKMPVAGQP